MMPTFGLSLTLALLQLCLLAAVSYAQLTGPSTQCANPDSFYIVQGVKCKACCIDCTQLMPEVFIQGSCTRAYYNYGCMANAPCATTASATMSELVAAVGFCSLFNGCRVKATTPQQLFENLTEPYFRNTRNKVGGYTFDFNHYRAGIIMDLPPSMYMHFQQAQEMELAISKSPSYLDYTRSAAFKKWNSANFYSMPAWLKRLTGTVLPTEAFFNNVKHGLTYSRVRGMTEEDISMTALKLASQQKTDWGNQMVVYGTRYGTNLARQTALQNKNPRTPAEQAELNYLNSVVPVYKAENENFIYNYYACRFSVDNFWLTSRTAGRLTITLRQFTDAYNAENPEFNAAFTVGDLARSSKYKNAMFGGPTVQSFVAAYPNRCIPTMSAIAIENARNGR